MWLNVLWRRWFGRTRPFPSHLRRRQTTQRRARIRLRLEALEDRTLLSGSGGMVSMSSTACISVKGASQFEGGQTLSTTAFLGGSFQDLSATGGGVYTSLLGGQWGAQASLNIAKGQVGLDATATASAGTVDASYKNVVLQQGFVEPTQFNQEVNFTPQTTNVSYGSGSFSTTSPSVGVSLGLDNYINGSISGEIAVGGAIYGSTSINGSLIQPNFISYDTTNGLSIDGQPIGAHTETDGTVDGVEVSGAFLPSVVIDVPLGDSGLSLSIKVEPNLARTGLTESVNFDAGYKDVVDGGLNLGEASQTLPSIDLGSGSLQDGGVLTDSGQSSIADLQLQMGPLVAAEIPYLSENVAAVDTDTVGIGPAELEFTPASFLMGPELSFAQTGTITPTNELTYNFYRVVTAPTSITPSVSGSGGSLAAGQYYYEVTSTTGPGQESTPSGEVYATTTGSSSKVALSWTAVKDATGYNVYRGTSADNLTYIGSASSSGGTVFFTDSGSEPSSSQTAPTTNTATTSDPMSVVVTKGGQTYSTTSLSFTPGQDSIGIQFDGSPILVQPVWKYGMDYTNEVDLDAGLTGTLTVGELQGSLEGVGSVDIGPLYQQSFSFGDVKLATVYDHKFSIGCKQKTLDSFIIGGAFTPSLEVGTTADGNTPYNPANPTGTGNLRAAVESANLLSANSPSGSLTQTPQIIKLGPGTYSLQTLYGGALNVTSQNLIVEGAGIGQTIINANGSRIFNVAAGANLTLEGVSVEDGAPGSDRNDEGGGVYNSGTLTVSDSAISDNGANYGGGIYNAGTLTVINSTISNNRANGNAGGIDNVGTLTVLDSTISDNTSGGDGGGIDIVSGMATVSNSTLAGNSALGGGGIANSGTLTVLNSTISDNSGDRGSGLYVSGPSLLENTIVAGNQLGSDLFGTLSSGSTNNLIGDDAKLAPLGNYGGPTQTMALLPGSPAIDAGSSTLAASAGLSTDQRGYARNVGAGVDIGAVEYQYGLVLNGSVASIGPSSIQYSYTVANIGPDPVADVTLTVPLPQGVAFQSQSRPAGWAEADPGAGNNGTVTFLGNLNSGQVASFTITAQLQNTAVGSILSNTATVGPATWDTVPHNSLTLTIANELEGQPIVAEQGSQVSNKVKLYHFTDPNSNAAPGDFTASVTWGDGSSNASNDASDTVFVVADPGGGFDVYGSHTYAEEGNYALTVGVTGLDGTSLSSDLQQLFLVSDAPLAAGALMPPPNAAVGQPTTSAVLFHFTDGDPNGKATDYTATVSWGDGSSNSSNDKSGTVSVVANAAGGFDVIGSHTYAQLLASGTFLVQVSDTTGTSTSASVSNFQVLSPDPALTAGGLTVPSVTTEGQSISNQVLFHFSDADSNALASDYLAAVSWGDGTSNSSNDGSGSVAVVANANGGFDVVGSHAYSEGSSYFSVKVTDLGDSRSTQPDLGGQSLIASSSAPLTISDPPVVVSAGPTFAASLNALSAVQTVATFTDPGGPEISGSTAPYVATIQWGDGTSSLATLTAQVDRNSQGQIVSGQSVAGIVLGNDDKTFSVNLAHQYATAGSYTITTTVLHDGITSGPVTTHAAVADPVTATGGFSIAGNAGVSTGSQTVATFTDPGGAGPVSEYSASINWGDGTSSQPDITSGVISDNAATGVFSVSGAHAYANVGSYPITVVIENFNAYPVTVSSSVSIAPATPNVTVNDGGGTYNGNPFPAIGKAVGVDNKTVVSGSFSYAYYDGTSTTGTSSKTAPTDAGTYTVVATFSSSDPNYTGGTAQTAFTIARATTAFSILAVQQVVMGAGATKVSGQLTSSTIVPAGQSVAITLNGVKQSAQVGADGTFSVSFATGALGVGTYTVNYNYAGNTNFTAASATGSLTVDYGSQLLFDNGKPVHSGACLPIKLALTDANGTDISSASIAVTATNLVDANGNSVSLKCEGNSNPNDLFRYDPSLGGYIFNLDTKGLAAGIYTLYYKAGKDPTLHSLTFVVD